MNTGQATRKNEKKQQSTDDNGNNNNNNNNEKDERLEVNPKFNYENVAVSPFLYGGGQSPFPMFAGLQSHFGDSSQPPFSFADSSQPPFCDWDQPMQLPPTIDLSDLEEGLTDWEKRLPRPIITKKDDGNYYFDGLGVQEKFLHDFKSAIGTGELGPSPVKVPMLCVWKDPSTHKHMLCYYKVFEIWEPSDWSKPPPKGFEIIGNDVFYAHLRLVIDQSGKASFKKTLTSLDSISFLDQYEFDEKAPGPAYSDRAHKGGPALGEHFSHLGGCRYYPRPGELRSAFTFLSTELKTWGNTFVHRV